MPVTSIRDVDWQSRQLNFVMMFNEPVFRGIETTSISAWKIPDDQKARDLSKFLRPIQRFQSLI